MAGSGFAVRSTQHSQNREEKREGSRAAVPSPAQAWGAASPRVSRLGAGASAVPTLSHEGTAPAHAPCSPGQPWLLLPAGIAALPLSGNAGSSQSSLAIAGSPAACTQRGPGTIYFLYAFPLAKRDSLGLLGLRCFWRLSLFPLTGDHAELQRNAGRGR